MIYITYYNMLSLPDVSCYFQLDYLKRHSDKEISAGDKVIFMMLKSEKKESEVTAADIYPVATRGTIESIGDGWALIRTLGRVSLDSVSVTNGTFNAEVRSRSDIEDMDPALIDEKFQSMRSALLKTFKDTEWLPGSRNTIMRWTNINELVTFSSTLLQILNEDKYAILEEDSLRCRVEMMEKAFYESLELYKVNSEARSAEAKSNEQLYREQAIKRQISFLEEELDKMHPENITDVRKFEKKIADSGMNEIARAEAEKVLNRMRQEGKDGHEYGMLYDYLDFVTALVWKKEKVKKIDLKTAEKVLDSEHYGLEKTKRRIIEQIAVMALRKKQAGSILLFVGAPGTGKTSIGQSIAKALKRSYVRVSLGGIRDEAEIRGHRRTYIGAMPGRIMDGIRRSGSSNPVMVLDEVDDSLELLCLSQRHDYGDEVRVKLACQIVYYMTIAGPFLVHLVDENGTGLVPVVQSSPKFDCLDLGAFASVDDHERRLA